MPWRSGGSVSATGTPYFDCPSRTIVTSSPPSATRIVATTSAGATPSVAARAWSTRTAIFGALSSTESSTSTMRGVRANSARTRLATACRPASSGP